LAEIVFIHGAADSGAVWQHQVQYFRERGHDVLAVDLPGHGSRLGETAFERIEDSAGDTLRLAKNRGMRSPILVGHSMGGGIALCIALAWPAWPRSLVLTASGARLRMRPEVIALAAAGAAASAPGVRVPRVITIDQVVSPRAVAQCRNWLLDRFGECTAQATYGDFLATQATDFMERLADVRQSTLIIGGQDDLWTPPKFQAYLAAEIPDTRLVMMPETGHYPFAERPEAFNSELDRFLMELAAV
jgi:pimeloyl-ACP methyl ester carboxylesterase